MTSRLGDEVADRLVAPIAGGIHSAHPRNLTADSVIPGLRAGLAREGSLVGAVAAIRAGGPKGNPVAQPVGGLYTLVNALVARIIAGGGEIRTQAMVSSLSAPDPSGQWSVTVFDAERNPNPALPPVPT